MKAFARISENEMSSNFKGQKYDEPVCKDIFSQRQGVGLVPTEEKSIRHQAIVSLCLTK